MTARFVFRHRWTTHADPRAVYRLLADADRYDRWWPQVRSAARLDEQSGVAVVRSLLPVSLRLHLTREVQDPATGVLQVRLAGDLEGWSRWTVADDGSALFEQECVVARPGLARVAPWARPVLAANHAWMMRGGERGLRRALRRGDGRGQGGQGAAGAGRVSGGTRGPG